MVLLTATPGIVEAVKLFNAVDGSPELEVPDIGGPIAHDILIRVSQNLQAFSIDVPEAGKDAREFSLNALLRGTKVYIPPPPPKAEKSPEYLALMARLRKEEEAKQYQKMLQHESNTPSFNQTATLASQRGALFPPPEPLSTADENDEMTYKDINRQIALIANVLISIVACSIGVWKAAWHWDVPARLALAMTSSIVVAVAEVAIYAGYLGRLEEAKGKEKRKVEKKRVVGSWRTEARARTKLKDGKEVVVGHDVVDKVLADGLRFREKVGRPK